MHPRPTPDATHWRTTAAVRVPETDGGNLAAAASRRLARGDGVETVDDPALQAIEPGLAATVVRIAVTVRVTAPLDSGAVEDRVAAAPGVQHVESVHRAE